MQIGLITEAIAVIQWVLKERDPGWQKCEKQEQNADGKDQSKENPLGQTACNIPAE